MDQEFLHFIFKVVHIYRNNIISRRKNGLSKALKAPCNTKITTDFKHWFVSHWLESSGDLNLGNHMKHEPIFAMLAKKSASDTRPPALKLGTSERHDAFTEINERPKAWDENSIDSFISSKMFDYNLLPKEIETNKDIEYWDDLITKVNEMINEEIAEYKKLDYIFSKIIENQFDVHEMHVAIRQVKEMLYQNDELRVDIMMSSLMKINFDL